MPTTFSPASASRPDASSPPTPSPITTTSTCSAMRPNLADGGPAAKPGVGASSGGKAAPAILTRSNAVLTLEGLGESELGAVAGLGCDRAQRYVGLVQPARVQLRW